MIILSSCLIWQTMSFILPLNEYGCVYAWTMLGNIATDRLTEDGNFGKKNHLFRWSLFWSWRLFKQEKLSYSGHRKPARIHWKADAPTTSRWQGEAVTVNGDRYQVMLNEFLFTKNLSGGYFNRAALSATQPKLQSMFCALFLKIVLSDAELTTHPKKVIVWCGF